MRRTGTRSLNKCRGLTKGIGYPDIDVATWPPGGRLSIKMSSYQYKIPMLKIRRSRDHLIIFNMGIPILGKTVFILRRAPGWHISFPIISWPRAKYVKFLSNVMNKYIKERSHLYKLLWLKSVTYYTCCITESPMRKWQVIDLHYDLFLVSYKFTLISKGISVYSLERIVCNELLSSTPPR